MEHVALGVAPVQNVFCKEAAYQSKYLLVVHFQTVLEVVHAVGAPYLIINIQFDNGLIGWTVCGLILALVDSLHGKSALFVSLSGEFNICLIDNAC